MEGGAPETASGPGTEEEIYDPLNIPDVDKFVLFLSLSLPILYFMGNFMFETRD